MAYHMQREIERVQRKIMTLCAEVEKNVTLATRAITRQNAAWADQVVDSDAAIDRLEVEIEEDCLKILALYQPVAVDLRVIVALLKINNDLERIGDLAVNIAQRAAKIAARPMPGDPIDFDVMVDRVTAMLRNSITALIHLDAQMAEAVCAADDEVDAMKKKSFAFLKQAIQKKSDDIMPLLDMHSTARNLERIADHATNIAEDVIYLASGKIVRHQKAQPGATL